MNTFCRQIIKWDKQNKNGSTKENKYNKRTTSLPPPPFVKFYDYWRISKTELILNIWIVYGLMQWTELQSIFAVWLQDFQNKNVLQFISSKFSIKVPYKEPRFITALQFQFQQAKSINVRNPPPPRRRATSFHQQPPPSGHHHNTSRGIISITRSTISITPSNDFQARARCRSCTHRRWWPCLTGRAPPLKINGRIMGIPWW